MILRMVIKPNPKVRSVGPIAKNVIRERQD
jgi:hypothetical protein